MKRNFASTSILMFIISLAMLWLLTMFEILPYRVNNGHGEAGQRLDPGTPCNSWSRLWCFKPAPEGAKGLDRNRRHPLKWSFCNL